MYRSKLPTGTSRAAAALLEIAFGAFAASGCVLSPEERASSTSDSSVAGRVDHIVNERLNGIAERVWFRYAVDPGATLSSYAAPAVTSQASSPWPGSGPCGAIMVGPNAMISAGHCHGDAKTAMFRVYVSAAMQQAESYNCDYLIQTWRENDFALHWCFPNNGVNPGDRWGYVDLDIDITPQGKFQFMKSRDRVRVDAPVYSIWTNPITSLGPALHSLYSEGSIVNTQIKDWFNSGGDPCSQDDDFSNGVRTNVWGRSGASGSAQLSSSNHRLLLPALSGAPNTPDGGPSRTGSAMADILRYSLIWDPAIDLPVPACGGRSEPQINFRALSTLWNQGIRFSNTGLSDYVKYVGLLDADQDGIVDMQHDLERSAGEGQRSVYRLGFESHRRNQLWSRSPNTEIHIREVDGFARTDTRSVGSGGWYSALLHPRLNLKQGARYLVRYTARASMSSGVGVCISGRCSDHALNAGETRVFVDEFPAGGPNLSLLIRGRSVTDFYDVVVAEVGAMVDFETHDQRLLWHRLDAGSSGDKAFVWPNGINSASGVDWAGIVRHSASSSPVRYSLATHQLPIPRGDIRVCFSHRRLGFATLDRGIARLRNVVWSQVTFSPRPDRWTRTCTPWVRVSTADHLLEFGVANTAAYTYAVDRVQVERRPSPTPNPSVPSVNETRPRR